jgi:nicotinate phosphoribosyltransferase
MKPHFLADVNPLARINVDEYMLTMGRVFFEMGWHEEQTTFETFVRSLPLDSMRGTPGFDDRSARTYLIARGMYHAVKFLETLRATDKHIQQLTDQGYDPAYIEFLRNWRFSGTVEGVPEGTAVTNQVPLASITGTRFDCEMVETAMLVIFGPHTMFTTKAARIVQAARGRRLLDFSMRRLQHPEVAGTVVEAAWTAGFGASASWEYAGERGVPTAGTMAHHFVMRFGPDREQEAYETWLRLWPERSVLLPDTYDTLRGISLIAAAADATGVNPMGVRLDSGDMAALSIQGRQVLDDAGYSATQISASSDLDEIKIDDMLSAGAKIDAFGVGTQLGTCGDAPSLGIVYKLVSQNVEGEQQHRMKLTAGKQTDPCRHRVWRRNSDRQLVLALHHEDLSTDHELLTRTFMQDGVACELDSLEHVRERVAAELAAMPEIHRFGCGAAPMRLERTQALWRLRAELGDSQAQDHLLD